jgi:hypothetical protein
MSEYEPMDLTDPDLSNSEFMPCSHRLETNLVYGCKACNDALRSEVERLRGERDEARARLFDQGRDHNASTCELGTLCPWCALTTALEERDQARLIADYRRDAIHNLPWLQESDDYQEFTTRVAARIVEMEHENDRLLAERDALRELLRKVSERMSDHVIGVNCHGPMLDVDTIRELRATLSESEEE